MNLYNLSDSANRALKVLSKEENFSCLIKRNQLESICHTSLNHICSYDYILISLLFSHSLQYNCLLQFQNCQNYFIVSTFYKNVYVYMQYV